MKNQLSMRPGCVVLAAAALLAACGGGGGEEGVARAPRGASEVPASALQSPEGLVAFQKSLDNSGDDATNSPLILGDATLPTSDASEPIAVN
ncbi:MAG: hypothetical protein K0S48_2950 [Ramlibacter sp.]|jgi:hypothetical protein|nr:hypothetical protein [Ramlibacter sp.]MCE3272320.1 hypothetical protein [Ramlibacter sp.]